MTVYNSLHQHLKLYSDRQIDWIYYNLQFQDRPSHFEHRKNALGRFANESDHNLKLLGDLGAESERYLVSDHDLEWFDKDDQRQMRWLSHFSYHSNAKENGRHIFNYMRRTETFFRDFVLTVDLWDAAISEKLRFIADAKRVWGSIIQDDNRLSWINHGDEEQIQWAWEYLSRQIDLGNTRPIDHSERVLCLLEVFDCWEEHLAELRELQNKMRKAWSQQKYRAGLNGRKQSTFVLSVTAKTQLHALSRVRNVNLHQMLESIIRKEFESDPSAKKLLK